MYDKLTGEVQVFETSLENCDVFKFTYNNPDGPGAFIIDVSPVAPSWLLEYLKPWCYLSEEVDSSFPVADSLLSEFSNWTHLISKCTNSTSVEDQDHRILFTLGYGLSSNESEVSGFMCEPKYSLTRRDVTNSTRNVGVQDSLRITREVSEILDMEQRPYNMTQKILASLQYLQRIPDMPDTKNIWYSMLHSTHPETNLRSFRNTSLAIELSQRMWKDFAAYIIKKDYTSRVNQTINGTAASTQGRLCVQELSLRFVEAHIMILLALTVSLYFLRPGAFHRDPTSLAAHAMVLARSPGLMNHLHGYGVAPKKVLRTGLSGYLASFPQDLPAERPAIALRIFREHSEEMTETSTVDNSDQREWWSPVPVRWWFRICLMTAILAVVISLEVLLQVSDRGNGLGDINLDGYLKYTWGFLPTLVLVLVGLLFSMLDSTARTLHPFQLLRKSQATMENMLHDPSHQVSLMAVIYALWKRHFVLLWAILPGLLAPVLTIITSALYTVAPVPFSYDAELELKDWFRPENRTVDGITNTAESDTKGEMRIVFDLTQFSKMSYPQWTHGQYALASFGTDNLHSHDGNDSSLYITARLPATRVNLNCSMIDHYDNDTHLSTQPSSFGPQWLRVDPRPLGCHTTPEWNRTAGQRELYLSSIHTINVDDEWSTSREYYLTLLSDDYETLVCQRDDYCPFGDAWPRTITSIHLCGDERQHFFIGVGYGEEVLSLLHCVPYVEALWVNATFTLPDLLLATDVSVSPDRESSVFLSDSASMTTFMGQGWQDFVITMVNGSSGVGKLTGLPSDPHNDNIPRLVAAMERTLEEYLAQNLHINYRQPVSGNISNASASIAGQSLLTPDGQPATGTVTDRTRLRLIQNTVSTRILQGLLAVMGACLVASTALGRGARVIPRDPGSVASRMAYFAGGEVWRRVPVGADRWTDEQIRKHGLGVSEGRLLLGWWGGDGREGFAEGARGKRFAVDSVGCKEGA